MHINFIDNQIQRKIDNKQICKIICNTFFLFPISQNGNNLVNKNDTKHAVHLLYLVRHGNKPCDFQVVFFQIVYSVRLKGGGIGKINFIIMFICKKTKRLVYKGGYIYIYIMTAVIRKGPLSFDVTV